MGTLALLSINGKSQSTMYRRERSESNAIIRKHSITETATHLTSENSNMLRGVAKGEKETLIMQDVLHIRHSIS